MKKSERIFKQLMRQKAKLSAEVAYKDILIKDCGRKVEGKTQAYRATLLQELYNTHPQWIPPQDAKNTVLSHFMAQFDADMAFQRKQAVDEAAKAVSKDPGRRPQENQRIAAMVEKQRTLRISYQSRLEAKIDSQLTAQENNAEREAALEEIEKKTVAFREEEEQRMTAEIEKIAKAEDAKIEALTNGINKLQAAQVSSGLSMPEGTVLSVKDLCMYFGGVHAVEHLSFNVKKGEIFGLIGPNGAGKTTVFNCITQFYKPTAGTLLFENRAGEVVSLTDEAVHDVVMQGIVRTFQNVEVIREVSVLENLLIAGHRQFTVGLAAQMLHLPSLKKQERIIREKALQVLEFMGLTAYQDWPAAGLPYGILKKIEIARTLMCDPQLIILDEPAAGLNDTETVELAELISRIRDTLGCTILLVEHDMGLVMNICQTICAISFGKLLAIGTPEEIQKNSDVQRAYLGESDEGVQA